MFLLSYFVDCLQISIGRNISHLIDRPDDPHCFRLQRDRVYYVRYNSLVRNECSWSSERVMKTATSVARDSLVSLGMPLGKFTKSGKFRLHVTSLDIIAKHAKFRIWVKANGEMPYLYGNHVLKAHVGRISEDTPEHQGVVIFSMNDSPLVTINSAIRAIDN